MGKSPEYANSPQEFPSVLLVSVCVICLFLFFFFSSRRRHTRLQGDWSSDVCSSDLYRPHQCPKDCTPPCAPCQMPSWRSPRGDRSRRSSSSSCTARATSRERATPDRKSTRLNSSHLVISYAVFCLKKKNTTTQP